MRNKAEQTERKADREISVLAHEVVFPHGEILGTYASQAEAQREADYVTKRFLIPTTVRIARSAS